jgi:diadenosine tetraphosphate (Ap4A) HIT family hydrolase
MKSTCKFCQKFGGTTDGDHAADQVLFESENFVVVPTVGAIIPGWLLVVPRSHLLCIGSFSEVQLQEFFELRAMAAEALRECYGPVAFFEHGAVRERESVGCGVDHAHLHIVATSLDLLVGATNTSQTKLQWCQVSGIQAAKPYVAKQMPYVFVQQGRDDSWIGTANTIESQLIRKVIATHAGQPDCWDWKTHPFEDNVRDTVGRLERWKVASAGISTPV